MKIAPLLQAWPDHLQFTVYTVKKTETKIKPRFVSIKYDYWLHSTPRKMYDLF